jgi:hypothetical protein
MSRSVSRHTRRDVMIVHPGRDEQARIRGTSADRSAKTGLRMALLGGAGKGLSLSVFD